MSRRVYLDHAASTFLHPAAADLQNDLSRHLGGNPSSRHAEGRAARAVMDDAREKVAHLLGLPPMAVFFTASGSESNNLALKGTLLHQPGGGLLTSAVEHASVLQTARWLHNTMGHPLTLLPVDTEGQLKLAALSNALEKQKPALLSVQWVNQETGVIQPLETIAGVAREAGVPLHTDAVQAPGAVDLNVLAQLPVDLLSLSAHKFGGPKGVGILLVRTAGLIEPLIHGGGQEWGKRAGTENPAAIAAAALALEITLQQAATQQQRIRVLRDQLWGLLQLQAPGLRLNGPPLASSCRAPAHLNVGLDGVSGEGLVIQMDLLGVAVSAGSACTSGSLTPSHVLMAMGRAEEQARSSVRFSLGPDTTAEDIEQAAAAFGRAVAALG